MRVYAAELICSTGVSGFQTFKPVFCICNKLRLHPEMLSYWVNDVIFSRSNPLMSYRSVLNVSNGGPSNPKLTQNKQPSDKTQSSKFCQESVEEYSESKIHMSEPESGKGNVNTVYFVNRARGNTRISRMTEFVYDEWARDCKCLLRFELPA